ncbi:MAG: outer membrane protein assembly factor BamB family protein, partial [Planctomycetota bacterium]|jgi:outer membrane protein assembly factor BamB
VQTLEEVMEQWGSRLLGVTDRRFVSVRDCCHLKLAALPPEALAVYRSRVDPVARKSYEEGVRQHDRRRLMDVVDQAFASSWGDNALFALGEMALESGDYAGARSFWEKVIPVELPDDAPTTWLCVPETELDLAAVRSRLVLTSILEGSLERAQDELTQFERLHPEARGWLGGREGSCVEALSTLLAESSAWPEAPSKPDWPTFAGSPDRNRIAPAPVDPAGMAWRVPLRGAVPPKILQGGFGGGTLRRPLVAESDRAPLSFHPVASGRRVLVNNRTEIFAFDLYTGKPAWGDADGRIYWDQVDPRVQKASDESSLGVPRFTATIREGKLYARMGSPVTSRPRTDPLAADVGYPGYLVCLDLEAEGRLMWKSAPLERGLSFEGSPVTNGVDVYVALRQSDIQPEIHVACLEAESGRVRWVQSVCAAETPARGMFPETTHTLLTLRRDTVYVNTNLGAVAAVSARDGRVKWVSLYPRVATCDLLEPAPHSCRDLVPCLYDRGVLLAAPSDSRRIFALDANNGQILWQTGPEVEDVVHLLGVAGDRLIAAGHKLYWISLKPGEAGRVWHVWPHGHEKLGYGRGVLAGDCVLWPTRDKIYVFDQTTGRQKRVLSLAPYGLTGGNLVVSDGYLLIATSDELAALCPSGSETAEQERIALRP